MTAYFHGKSSLPALAEPDLSGIRDASEYIQRMFNGASVGRGSARRGAQFDKAAAVMRTASAVAGANCIPEHFDHTRTGLPWGLCVELSYDRMMIWSPRGGFQVSDVLPMPF